MAAVGQLVRRVVGFSCLCAVAACTQHNPFFLGGSAPPDLSAPSHDLSVVIPHDAAQPAPDLAAVDLARPAVVDLAASDLSTPVISCNDMLCAGCCVAGVCHPVGDICTAGSVCAPGGVCSACGNLSQPCCSLNFCNGALVCNGGTCSTCGAPGAACCAGQTCAAGGCCVANLCQRSGKTCGVHKICLDTACSDCGASGQPCCADNSCNTDGACCNTDNRTCAINGAACGGGGTCNAGSCNGAGGIGESCFQTPTQTPNLCSASTSVCDDSTGTGTPGGCQTCGTDGLPCCGVSTCADGGCCVAGVCHANATSCGTAGGNCAAGACNGGTCGGLGQPCCGGTLCTAPDSRCITPAGGGSAACQPCGGKDQRCCVDPQSGLNIFCEPPYTTATVVVAGMNVGFCR